MRSSQILWLGKSGSYAIELQMCLLVAAPVVALDGQSQSKLAVQAGLDQDLAGCPAGIWPTAPKALVHLWRWIFR